MRIGLIGMSGKPYHLGHDGLVRLAAGECDEVHLYVSLSDRARPGEVPILGSDMKRIWKLIEPTLPANVRVTYGGSPIKHVWEELGLANESGSLADTYVIYADPEDLAASFPKTSLLKYADSLTKAKKIKLRAVERSSTVNVSGTMMRQYLADGDEASFVANLPRGVDKEAIWQILHKTAVSRPSVRTTAGAKTAAKKGPIRGEGLVKEYVRLLVERRST